MLCPTNIRSCDSGSVRSSEFVVYVMYERRYVDLPAELFDCDRKNYDRMQYCPLAVCCCVLCATNIAVNICVIMSKRFFRSSTHVL